MYVCVVNRLSQRHAAKQQPLKLDVRMLLEEIIVF